jgi:hypothetical protein
LRVLLAVPTSDVRLAFYSVIIRSIIQQPLLLYLCDVAYERLVPRLENLMENHIVGFAVLHGVQLVFVQSRTASIEPLTNIRLVGWA